MQSRGSCLIFNLLTDRDQYVQAFDSTLVARAFLSIDSLGKSVLMRQRMDTPLNQFVQHERSQSSISARPEIYEANLLRTVGQRLRRAILGLDRCEGLSAWP